MYFFFKLTIKSPEHSCWCHSAVFIGSPVRVLPIAYFDLEKPTVHVLEQNSIGKRPKDFEASGFPSCVLNNTHFFETSHRNQKNVMMSGKVRTFSKQNGICKSYFEDLLYYEDFVYLCYRQTKWYM